MQPTNERNYLVAGSLLAGAAAWIFFRLRPPMHALAGMTRLGDLVPAHYQASVFPAFFAFSATAVLEAHRDRAVAWRRAALVVVTGLLAVVRLGGALPLSGHAIFLSAMIAFESVASVARPSARLRLALAAAGLGVTSFYKLFVWGDAGWLAASLIAGAAIGFFSSPRSGRRGTGCRTRALSSKESGPRSASPPSSPSP